jgi:hypothetical protein
MKALAIATFLLGAATATFAACASSSSQNQGPAEEVDATTVDPTYCTKYCEAQANNGTLAGTLKQCESDCCTRVPDGCSSSGGDGGHGDAGGLDGGGQDGSGGDSGGDGGGDGSTCAIPCGTQCCGANQGCANDGQGGLSCVATCKTASDCPTTKCCAPATNAAGDPVGPYICKPDDGQNYNCCTGLTTDCKGSGYCCVVDGQQNQFCALKCSSNTACGAGHCVGYDFSIFNTTCSGPTACGP